MPSQWRKVSNGHIPSDAFNTGAKDSGRRLFVARAEHKNGMHPGRYHEGHKGAHLPYGGVEHVKHDYEILCSVSGLHWCPMHIGFLPWNAVKTGYESTGYGYNAPLYSVKGVVNRTEVIGKYNHEHKRAYFPYGTKEHTVIWGDIKILCYSKYVR